MTRVGGGRAEAWRGAVCHGCEPRREYLSTTPLGLQVGWGDIPIGWSIGREGRGLCPAILTLLFSASSSNQTVLFSPSLPASEPAFRLDSQLFGFPLTLFFKTVSPTRFLTWPALHGKPLSFAFSVTGALSTCFLAPLTVLALFTQHLYVPSYLGS